MTMDELMTQQRIETIRKLDSAWVMFQEEALAERSGGLRRAFAAFFVRIGMVLDRGTVERAARSSAAAPAHTGGDDGLAWHLR